MTSIDKIARAAPRPAEERRKMLRAFDPSLEGSGVWVVVPCYRVKAHILDVIAKTPAWVIEATIWGMSRNRAEAIATSMEIQARLATISSRPSAAAG